MKSEGRMIRKDISRSHKIGSLSPKSLSLFCLLIAHYNAHGKINGSPYFIKGEVCPLVNWLEIEDIVECMKEITQKTNVKQFVANGLPYIHSVNFGEHQSLRRDRMGYDNIPSYSGSTPGGSGTTPAEVKLSKVKLSKVKGGPGVTPASPPTDPKGSSATPDKSKKGDDVNKEEIKKELRKIKENIGKKGVKNITDTTSPDPTFAYREKGKFRPEHERQELEKEKQRQVKLMKEKMKSEKENKGEK